MDAFKQKKQKKLSYRRFTPLENKLLGNIYKEVFFLIILLAKIMIFILKKNKYPSKQEIAEIAKETKTKISKIENWLKHKRRNDVKKGVMKFEVFYFF